MLSDDLSMKNIIVLIAIVFSIIWSPSVFAKAKAHKRAPASVGQKHAGKSHAAVYRNAKAKRTARSVASAHSKKVKAKKGAAKYKAHAKKKKHKY